MIRTILRSAAPSHHMSAGSGWPKPSYPSARGAFDTPALQACRGRVGLPAPRADPAFSRRVAESSRGRPSRNRRAAAFNASFERAGLRLVQVRTVTASRPGRSGPGPSPASGGGVGISLNRARYPSPGPASGPPPCLSIRPGGFRVRTATEPGRDQTGPGTRPGGGPMVGPGGCQVGRRPRPTCMHDRSTASIIPGSGSSLITHGKAVLVRPRAGGQVHALLARKLLGTRADLRPQLKGH
jgi:hypothetical protein